MPFLGDFFLTKKGFATFRELINFIEIIEILIFAQIIVWSRSSKHSVLVVEVT